MSSDRALGPFGKVSAVGGRLIIPVTVGAGRFDIQIRAISQGSRIGRNNTA